MVGNYTVIVIYTSYNLKERIANSKKFKVNAK